MKSLKIAVSDVDKLKDVLRDVQGNCSVNLLSSERISAIADFAETELEQLGIPKKNRMGAEFTFCPAGPEASSYSFPQGATSLLLVRKSSLWFVKEIGRAKVYPRARKISSLILSPGQRDIAVKKLCQSFITRLEV